MAWLCALVVLNILASYLHTRLDLTEDKRYTLSASTKKLLRHLDDKIMVQVLLKGKYPAGFRQLAASTQDLLDEFREYANGKLQYVFINPGADLGDSAKAALFDSLRAKGIQPYNLRVQQDINEEGVSERLVFPGAILKYKGKELGIDLLQSQVIQNQFESLNSSTALLEYKFANAIYRLQQKEKPLVGYALGHGEPLGLQVYDALNTLQQHYQLDTINIKDASFIPRDFAAIVIVKPTNAFNEKDKLKIDQYIMHGGKVLWMIDNLNAELDSLRHHNNFIAFDRGLNLEDQLFKYGLRINPNLIQDLYCDQIPLVVGAIGHQPQMQFVPWPYFPLFTPTADHPIVKNMDAVVGHFVNSIDTTRGGNIRKTVLLASSRYSRTVSTPVLISWETVKMAPRPQEFRQQFLPAAVLLEGSFTSVFKNRLGPAAIDSFAQMTHERFLEKSVPNKMIVAADADIITNAVSQREGPLPMGMNEYNHAQFANKEFFLNSMEYLTNTSGIMETRAKDYKLRLLDINKVKREKTQWQLLNFALPIGFVLLFGMIFRYLRQRRYAA